MRDAVEEIPFFGGYAVDDDGVRAAAVTLVEDGLLKAFYMGRIPTKEIPLSNGHGRRMGGRVTGQPANLLVSTAEPIADLKERLRALCREEGVPYGLVIERFDLSGGGLRRAPGGPGGRGRGFGGPPAAERSELPDALAFRKLYVDGREEIVRGGRVMGVTARTLRSIAAAGTDRNAATRRLAGGPAAVTIVAPSIIVTGLDVRPTPSVGERAPLIPRPTLAANDRTRNP
jgi:hypothetical protein